MLREKLSQRSWRSESTDAEHRDGAVRSSDETFVMKVERRGCVVQRNESGQPKGRNHNE